MDLNSNLSQWDAADAADADGRTDGHEGWNSYVDMSLKKFVEKTLVSTVK